MKRVVLFAVALSASLYADGYDAKLGTVELGAGGGIVRLPGSITRPVGYTRVGVGLHKALMAFGEVGYVPLENSSFRLAGSTVRTSSAIATYSGGVQIQIPTGTRVTPYAMASVGGLNAISSASVSGIGSSSAMSATLFATNVGGGAKVFFTRRLGMDINARALRVNESGAPFVPTATVGVFWQFNKAE